MAKFSEINRDFDLLHTQSNSLLDSIKTNTQRNVSLAWQGYNTLLQATTVPLLDSLGLMDHGQRNALEFEFGAGGSKQLSGGGAWSFGIDNMGKLEMNSTSFATLGKKGSLSLLPEKLGGNINFSFTKGYDMGIKDLTQGRIVTGGVNFDLPTKRSYLPNEVRMYEGFITTQATGPLVPAGRLGLN